jgi:hypothetical protein
MRLNGKLVLAHALLALGALTAPALAQSGGLGLDGIHDQRREGGRTCMTDHFHSGSSAGQASKKLAEASAVRDWAGFTAFEYGDAWGRWTLAASKSLKCSKSGSSWSCNAEARPCRAGR